MDKIAIRLSLLLAVAALTISCGSGRSISQDATVAGSGDPVLQTFSESAIEGAAKIVDVLQGLPMAVVEYGLDDWGGLYTASMDPDWRTAGIGNRPPMIQVSRGWDVAPDGMDVTGGNQLRFDASALAGNGRRATIELSMTFQQTSVLASYDELTLDQLAQALATETFTVDLVFVDLAFDPASVAPGSTRRAAISTFDSGAGYSTYADDGETMAQATDLQLVEIADMMERAVEEIHRSWLESVPVEDVRNAPTATSAAVEADILAIASVCELQCEVTGKVTFDHQTWGPSVLYTILRSGGESAGPGEAHIVVLDGDQKVVWQYSTDGYYELAPAEPPVDNTAHMFINFNPGRLNGVIVLSSIDGDFDDYATLPPEGGYRSRFYGAYAVDVEGDGRYEIKLESNECDPSCTTGMPTSQLFRWDGQDYKAE